MRVHDGAVAAAEAHELVESDAESAHGVVVDAALPRRVSAVGCSSSWLHITCSCVSLNHRHTPFHWRPGSMLRALRTYLGAE